MDSMREGATMPAPVGVVPVTPGVEKAFIDLDPAFQVLNGWDAIAGAVGADGMNVKTVQALRDREGLPVANIGGSVYSTRLALFLFFHNRATGSPDNRVIDVGL